MKKSFNLCQKSPVIERETTKFNEVRIKSIKLNQPSADSKIGNLKCDKAQK